MSNNFLNWIERPAKRIRLIENALKNDPFLYHKKKNVISSRFNDSNNDDGQNINQELLLFQDENNKHLISLKSKINTKSSTIDNNTQNYLNYMMREKSSKSLNKILTTEPVSPITKINVNKITEINNNNEKLIKKFPYQESFTPNKYSSKNLNDLTFSNYRNNANDRNDYNNNKLESILFNNNINEINSGIKKNNSNSYKILPHSFDKIDILKNNETNNNKISYLPRIQSYKGMTDITDNNYYDKISKQLIIQMNKNYNDYNQNLVNKRYNSNKENKLLFLRNEKIPLPPGHIANPRYYNLGESRLRSNPIVNPGNRAPIFNNLNNNNHRLKSEFIYGN